MTATPTTPSTPSTARPIAARVPAAVAATGLSAPLVTSIVYFLCILAATVSAVTIVEVGLVSTMAAAFGAWAVVTLIVYPKRRAASLGAFVAVTTALALRNYSELALGGRAWAFANLAVLLSPFVTTPLRRTKGFPFLHIWCLVEAVYVYISSMVSRPLAMYEVRFTPEIRAVGYQTLFLFTATLVATGTLMYRVFGLRLTKQQADERERRIKDKIATDVVPRAYALLIGASLLLVATTATGLAARLGSVNEAIRAIAFAGGLILAMLWLDGRLRHPHKFVLVGAAGAVALTGLGSGLLYQSAVPGIVFLALLVGHRRRVPWAPLIVAMLVVVVLNVNKSEFRAMTWNNGITEANADLGLSFLQFSGEKLETANEDRISQAANRFGNSDLLGYTVTWVPDRYPYFGYQTYTSLPQLLVPRALLPDKGSFNQANEFGREYDLIARSDYLTSVNTPLHVESYVAGGPLFMVLIAGLCGFLLVLFGFLLRSGSAAAEIAGCALCVQVVLTIESGILGLVLVVPFMLFLMPILWWACKTSPSRPLRPLQGRRAVTPVGRGQPRVRSI